MSLISVICSSDQELKGRRECQIIEDAHGVCACIRSNFKEHLEVKLKRVTLDNMIKCKDQIKGASAAGFYAAGSAKFTRSKNNFLIRPSETHACLS